MSAFVMSATCSQQYTALPGAAGTSNDAQTKKLKKTMWWKVGQSFNPAGILLTMRVILREPQLAIPHLSVPDITHLDWKALKRSGFQGVVFDKDNTLTPPYLPYLWPSLAASLDDCKSTFDGNVAIFSNSAGLHQFDPDGSEAKAVEDVLGIPVIRHGSKKPAGSVQDVKHFFGCDLSLLVMVGDRHFTDIVYGNRYGLLTIYTEPLTDTGEPFIVRQVRKLEGIFIRRWRRMGILPSSHKLCSSQAQFIKAYVSKNSGGKEV